MDRQEIINRLTEIGTCENEADRRVMLADLETDLNDVFDNVDTLTENVRTLTEDNKTLTDANTKLFLKMGENRNPDEGGEEPPKEKRKFENLFDENGGIK